MWQVAGKKIVVLGMARSGIAAAKLLSDTGALVRLADQKSTQQLGDTLDSLRGIENIEWRLGEDTATLIEGEDALVISPGVPIDSPVILRAQNAGLEILGEMELAYRLSQGRLTAITGTNGKTTTTTLMGEIFRTAGRTTYVVGNIGFPYSSIAAQTCAKDEVVCEVSSFQLESIKDFRPAISAILNITEDHLNRHHTMENYIAMKARIFENQSNGDTLVLNYDDPLLQSLANQAHCRVNWFSRRATPPFGAYVRAGRIVYGSNEDYEDICATGDVYIPGSHNLENALAAVAMARAADVPADLIARTLASFQGVEHRIEFVRELNGVRFINDSKGTNADSTIKAVETMDRPTVIILGGSDKHVDFTGMCEVIRSSPYICGAVLIGETAPQIEETLNKVGFDNITCAGNDFQAAIVEAFRQAHAGGNVLLSPACASFDMFKDYEQRGEIFKRIVHALPGRLE